MGLAVHVSKWHPILGDQTCSGPAPRSPSCHAVTPKPSFRPLLAGREPEEIHVSVTLKCFGMGASPAGSEVH